MEGIRLRGTVVLARYVPPTSEAQTVTDTAPCLADPADPQGPSPIPNPHAGSSERTYTIPPGGRAIIDLVSASHDASAFPDPETLKVDRPLEDYLPWGFGPHKCLGDAATRIALVTAFKGIVALPGLTRAPGPRGHTKNVEFKEWRGQIGRKAVEGGGDEWTGLRAYMRADEGSFWPVPSTMRVRWNAKDSRGRSLEPSWVDLGQ
jgi:linoleate 8R-lipoxygenase/9,12-octadecadienoate 8-hydroperoxide 8R-isomerase/linoleate 8R-lipoxygenase/9,12-octadecadienoate 8-hydroperoxide 8S-isomerase